MHPLSRRRFFALSAKAGTLAPFALAPSAFAGTKPSGTTHPPSPDHSSEREQWLAWLKLVAEPVLAAAGKGELRQSMPVEAAPGHQQERAIGAPLEAIGRLLCGIAPWLELEPTREENPSETALRTLYRTLAQQAITHAVHEKSPDYMRFGQSAQTLVDSSFLSLAILRAPRQLLATMDPQTSQRLTTAIKKERTVQSPFNNWLLFAALNEVMLKALGADWDRLRIDYALREHQSWYLGDGIYGDGPEFHADFYNSYVIHPYLLAVLEGVSEQHNWDFLRPLVIERARRYAAIQERLISPAGEFPILGRSLTYRAGAFHLLADVSRRGILPEHLAAGAVRSALTAVQHRTLSPAGTFTPNGWLQIGVAGHQPFLGETYISTGSLYLCSAVWLPLGLPPAHPFWAAPAAAWTQKSVWSGDPGDPGTLDHALTEPSRR